MKKYPDEVRQKVSNMIKSGTSKLDASRKFGIPYRTVIDWTFDIKMRRAYPEHMRNRVRTLAKKSLSKTEVARITGVNYHTVLNYTRGIRMERKNTERVAGTSLKLLRELVANGFAFSGRGFKSSYMTLRKYFPVKRVESGRNTIFYLNGSERTALEAFLTKLNWRSIDYQRLGRIRQAFGIKNIKMNNKIMERFSK